MTPRRLSNVNVETVGMSTPQELLDHLVAAVAQADVPQHPDFVRIMSLHKSKGLTSPSVFIVGAVQGVIPTLRTRDSAVQREAAIEEQRRLFYVGITRWSDQLTVSHALRMEVGTAYALGVEIPKSTIRKQGKYLMGGTIASQYLRELGAEAPRPQRGIDWIAGH